MTTIARDGFLAVLTALPDAAEVINASPELRDAQDKIKLVEEQKTIDGAREVLQTCFPPALRNFLNSPFLDRLYFVLCSKKMIRTPFEAAAMLDWLDVFEFCHSRWPPVDSTSALQWATLSNSTQVLQYLQSKGVTATFPYPCTPQETIQLRRTQIPRDWDCIHAMSIDQDEPVELLCLDTVLTTFSRRIDFDPPIPLAALYLVVLRTSVPVRVTVSNLETHHAQYMEDADNCIPHTLVRIGDQTYRSSHGMFYANQERPVPHLFGSSGPKVLLPFVMLTFDDVDDETVLELRRLTGKTIAQLFGPRPYENTPIR